MAEWGALVRRVQSSFVRAAEPHRVFDVVLPDLLELTASEYGYIGEVWRRDDGAPFLKIFTLSNIAWDAASRDAVERHRVQGIEFHNLKTLFGAALVTGRTVVANDAPRDPRSGGGMPPGHPPLETFLGIPLHYGGELVGMIGLANRKPGYDDALLEALEPLEQAIAGIIAAVQLDRERRRAEAALHERDRRYQNTFDHAAIGIAHLTPEGRFVEANRRFGEIVGHPPASLRGRHFREITHSEDTTPDLVHLQALLRGDREVFEQEKRYLHADGSLVWAQLTVTVARTDQGRPEHLIAVIHDMTDRRLAQEARIAAAAAERANEAKTEFLSRMSHELRTPLNAVLGFSQLLLAEPAGALKPAQRERVQHVERAGRHLLAMIGDVLDLSRIETNSMALAPASLDVRERVDEAVSLVLASAQAAGVRIYTAHGPRGLKVLADAVRLQQVLLNLLSNAIKYNRDGGEVTIEVSEHAGFEPRVSIAVHDTGIGFGPSQSAKLFEPFNRLGAERSGIEGTGLGLAIARRLAALMHGSIEVTSQRGVGSTFLLTLPAAEAPQPQPPQHPPSGLQAGAPGFLPPYTVLYAEDNALNVELMTQALGSRPGCCLRIARSGLQAIALARAEPPDVLLLDMHLGDMTGLDVAAALRRDVALAQVPRVVLSADAMAESRQEALAAGFSDYLTKPVDLPALFACLDRLVAARRGPLFG